MKLPGPEVLRAAGYRTPVRHGAGCCSESGLSTRLANAADWVRVKTAAPLDGWPGVCRSAACALRPLAFAYPWPWSGGFHGLGGGWLPRLLLPAGRHSFSFPGSSCGRCSAPTAAWSRTTPRAGPRVFTHPVKLVKRDCSACCDALDPVPSGPCSAKPPLARPVDTGPGRLCPGCGLVPHPVVQPGAAVLAGQLGGHVHRGKPPWRIRSHRVVVVDPKTPRRLVWHGRRSTVSRTTGGCGPVPRQGGGGSAGATSRSPFSRGCQID